MGKSKKNLELSQAAHAEAEVSDTAPCLFKEHPERKKGEETCVQYIFLGNLLDNEGSTMTKDQLRRQEREAGGDRPRDAAAR
jgi:hypothetical protein